MKIAVDARCLLEKQISGVGEYALNILSRFSNQGEITLFSNATKHHLDAGQISAAGFSGFKTVQTRIPNKLFNLSQSFGLAIPDLIAGVSAADSFWLPNLNFFKTKRPYTVTVHDLSYEIYPELFSLRMRLWHRSINPAHLLKKAKKVIAVSENTATDLKKFYGLAASQINVIHSGIGPEFFVHGPTNREVIRKKYNLPEKFILYLGTIEPRKNIGGLIEAFEIMKRRSGGRLKDLGLVIGGGNGWLYKKILDQINKSPERPSIKLLGYIDRTDRPGVYQAASMFVFPSFYEGFGFPPLEAVASQVPVVSSFAGSLGEILDKTASLIDPYNINQLAAAMAETLASPPSQAELTKRAKIVREKYSWARTAEQTWQTISSL